MLQDREFSKCMIYNEMRDDDKRFWFDYKQRKFLHNIDTFYYSVKFQNDFTRDSHDPGVLKLRNFFQVKYAQLDNDPRLDTIQVLIGDDLLNLKRFSFAHFYSICLEKPDWFDLFLAPNVPRGSDGGSSVTCELVVQLRSYMLWMYGVHVAFERSYQYVKDLAFQFGLEISFCQENRVDYCWHSNYLSNPEKFFSLENFYKMRVDRFHDALTHTEKVGSEGFEIDYIALGKRSDKVFIRIYLKCKEVVEQAYKGWFFYMWFFQGLISRYDLYVYEECYKRRNWKYLDFARCGFYLQYGMDMDLKVICGRLLSGDLTMEEDSLRHFADQITPKVTLVMNVEYQTMRRHSKSYQLLPIRDNSFYGPAKRIYDYLDNRRLIMDYLTFDVLRLVEPNSDSNKSRRGLCGFWKALRSCKCVDVKFSDRDLKLVREYSRSLNAELIKSRVVNGIIMYGFYQKGVNDDAVIKDVADALCTLNDNDMEKALRYKNKKARQLNSSELTGNTDFTVDYRFNIVDHVTGEIYGYDNTECTDVQGGVVNE